MAHEKKMSRNKEMTLETIFHNKSSRKRSQSFSKLFWLMSSSFERSLTSQTTPNNISLNRIACVSPNDSIFTILKITNQENSRTSLSSSTTLTFPKRTSCTPSNFSYLDQSRFESASKVFQNRVLSIDLPFLSALNCISLLAISSESNILVLSQDHEENITNLSVRMKSSPVIFGLTSIPDYFVAFASSIVVENAAI